MGERKLLTQPNIKKRIFLRKAGTLVGAGIAIVTFSQAERAYAEVKTAVNLRERRKGIYPAHFPFLDTQAAAIDVHQGQPVLVQVTATPDLQATKTELDIQSDRLTIQKQQTDNTWAFWTDVGTPASVLVTGVLGVAGYLYNRGKDREAGRAEEAHRREDQEINREKQDEARFQEAVLALGDKDRRLGAATTLRTFLQEGGKGYERFYQQIFDLTVGFLRDRENNPNNPEPNTFYKEIIRVFSEVVPLVRTLWNMEVLAKSNPDEFDRIRQKFLNASDVNLNGAELRGSDLKFVEFSGASFIKALMWGADLYGIRFDNPNLSGADLRFENLQGGNLISVNFTKAHLFRANLSGADLIYANLQGANLQGANLHDARLSSVDLTEAILQWADLRGADLQNAKFNGAYLQWADLCGADLSYTHPEEAELGGTKMFNVKGLKTEQIEACQAKSANFQEHPPVPKTTNETK